MPKKKTGQRKKAEKQKIRQKEIRSKKENLDLVKFPCNSVMVSFFVINIKTISIIIMLHYHYEAVTYFFM